MAEKPQDFKNHTRFDPVFHFFLIPVGLILLIGAVDALVRYVSWANGWRLLATIWAIVAVFKIRLYALKVQDRVIRLEERLRLQRLLPDALKPRIVEVTERQLVALRFASDEELPGLVEKTLAGNWDNKQIKHSVQYWRPDYWRV